MSDLSSVSAEDLAWRVSDDIDFLEGQACVPRGEDSRLHLIELVRRASEADPTHVALMEAVCEADDPEPTKYRSEWRSWRVRQELRATLAAYRNDHKEETA